MKQWKLIARNAYKTNPGPLIGLGFVTCINSVVFLLIQVLTENQNRALYTGLSQILLFLLQPLIIGYSRFVLLTYLVRQPSPKEFFHFCSSIPLVKKTLLLGLILSIPGWLFSWLLYAVKSVTKNSAVSAFVIAIFLLFFVFLIIFSIYTFLSLFIFISDSEKDMLSIFKESAQNMKGYVLDFIALNLWALFLWMLFIIAGLLVSAIFKTLTVSLFRVLIPSYLFLVSLILEPYINLVFTGFAVDTLGIRKIDYRKNKKDRKLAQANHKNK